MENLHNEFVVNRPIEQAWAVLTDVERIAPCLPGAQLQEIEGDTYRGVVKVKLGPISTAFKGQAHFVERDDAGHRAVLRGEGRDTGGKGNADALITAQMEALTATTSRCTVTTELRVTGKVAQFGRGIMGDISEKLMTQFANNLNAMLDADQTPAVAPAAAPAAAAEAPAVRTIEGPHAAPIELSGLAGGAVLKRVLPVMTGIALVVVAAVLIWR
ncbi:MAG: SRPBCC family protein [Actinomycetota bacterium]|nr:SRPBCC family protein [Actinomycetota bacterium]